MEKLNETNIRIMDSLQMKEVLDRMAEAISQDINLVNKCILVGIRTRGVYLADRLQKLIKEKTGLNIPIGSLDITLYRDDWTRLHFYPVVRSTTIPGSLEHKYVVLIDDVLYTGRTVRAALDALLDYGRPDRVYLAVLIDRGHRELPICAQYIGKKVETEGDEHIDVRLKECDGIDEVLLLRK